MAFDPNMAAWCAFALGSAMERVKKNATHRFCVEGLLKILHFDYFVLIWWETDKKQEILKQSCNDLFI